MTAPEKLNRWLVMSIVLHVALAAVVVFGPSFLPSMASESWGSNTAGDSMSVKSGS